ncbi:tryptophan synthase subunit beta like protein [Halomonas sp. Bachu 37]|uniref:tryptophan synthase subunit beta like protein n=1 Tax=Halomonas kashgarensis TaxID=3084920 RepID=UPI003216574A
MLYAKRNADGEIIMISRTPIADSSESIAAESPEVLAFLTDNPDASANFLASDLEFVRVLEDILEVLLEKGVINFMELPEAAQQKVMKRKSLRVKNNFNLLGGDNDTI